MCFFEVSNAVLHRLRTEVVRECLIHTFLQTEKSWPRLSSFTYLVEEFSLKQGCLLCLVCKILLLHSNSRTAAVCLLEQAQGGFQTPQRASEVNLVTLVCSVTQLSPCWDAVQTLNCGKDLTGRTSLALLSRCEQTCGQRLRALERGWLTMTHLPQSVVDSQC